MLKRKYTFWGILTPLFIICLIYQYSFEARNFEKICKTIISKYTGGELELEVKKASLFYGFEIENLKLSIKKTKQEVLFFRYGRLATFLPALLIGELSIRELTLRDARLHLNRVRGRWDWSQIFVPNYIDPKKEEWDGNLTEAMDSIPMFLPIRVHAKIDIYNFAYYMDMDEMHFPSDTKHKNFIFGLKVEGFDLHLTLLTKTFRKLSLSLNMADIFDTLILAINPKQKMFVSYKMDSEFQGFPIFKLFIYKDLSHGNLEFQSRLLLDLNGGKLITPANKITNYHLKLFYDIFYEPQSERLVIKNFNIIDKAKPDMYWINFKAVGYNFDKEYRSMELEMQKSRVDLSLIGKLVSDFASLKKPPFGGIINFDTLKLFGNFGKLDLEAKISGREFYYTSEAKQENVSSFEMELNALANFYKLIPIEKKPIDYKEDTSLAFYLFHKLLLKRFIWEHDKISLNASAEILPEKGINAQITLNRYALNYFLDDDILGNLKGNLNLRASNNYNHINFDLKGTVEQASYIISKSKAKNSLVVIDAQGLLNTQKNLILNFNRLNLKAHTENGKPFATLDVLNSVLNLDRGKQDAKLGQIKLLLKGDEFFNSLPKYIQKKYKLFKIYVTGAGNELITLTSPNLSLYHAPTETSLRGMGLLKIPALNLDDLNFSYDINFKPQSILFRKAELFALKQSLKGNLAGSIIKKAGEWESNLEMELKINNKNLTRIHENLSFQGNLNVKGKLDKKYLEAYFNMNYVNMEIFTGKCENIDSIECKSYFINDLELNHFNIKHELKPSYKYLSQESSHNYINNNNNNNNYNFKIRSLSASHTPRGIYIGKDRQNQKNLWYYVGKPNSKEKGFQATLIYKNNSLLIPILSLKQYRIDEKEKNKWLHNGSIYAQNSFIDFYNLDSKLIQAKLQLKVSEFNLEQYLPASRIDYNGIVSTDMKAYINGFHGNIVDNMYGEIFIHHLSPEFAGFITRFFMPAQIMAFMVRSFLEIPTIHVRFKKGLFFTKIGIERSRIIPGILFSSKNNEFRQDRIPFTEFVKIFRSEIKNFNSAIEQYQTLRKK